MFVALAGITAANLSSSDVRLRNNCTYRETLKATDRL